MNIFEMIFGKKAKAEKDLLPALEAEIAAALVLAEQMRAPMIECVPQPESTSTRIDESRYGGWPAWPKGQDLPVDAKGKPMTFLAQINFADAPSLKPYPDSGLLQIFVSDDDLFGCEFPSQKQDGFRMVFHKSVEGLTLSDPYNGTVPEFMPFEDDNLCNNGLVIAFNEGTALPSYEDFRIAKLSDEWWEKYNLRWVKGKPASITMSNAVDAFYDKLASQNSANMFYGGHPRFTQTDIRSVGKFANYEHVIMQFGMPHKMMWGDAGEACFLMTEDDLKARRFENAIYNWDCG